jgi:DNA-binding response OmpR family regulator
MPYRTVRVLHIEDEPSEQLLVQTILSGVEQFGFEVVAVPGEEQAIAQFGPEVELVILDYNLTEGDGLSCLRRLRQMQPRTPIIVLSGKATPEIAAELLRSGADDYFSKLDLDPEQFRQGVSDALARADAWKQRQGREIGEIGRLLSALVVDFIHSLPAGFAERLDQLSESIRQAGVTPSQLERLFNILAKQHGERTALLSRPLLLETAWRAYQTTKPSTR